MADVSVDATISTSTARGARAVVFPSELIGYCFYLDSDGVFGYSKTTDGGATWNAQVDVDSTAATTTVAYDIWFDQWTPGDSGTLIHCWWFDTANDITRYRSLNITGDVLGTQRNVFTESSAVAGRGAFISGTKTRSGYLYVAYDIDAGAERGFRRSTDGGVTWSATNLSTSFVEATLDTCKLFPASGTGDNNDCWALYYDASANALTLKMWDSSAASEVESATIQTHTDGATDLTGQTGFDAAVRHTDGHLIVAAISTRDVAAGTHQVFDCASTSVITTKTAIAASMDDHYYPQVFINQGTGTIFVAYNGKRDGSEVLDTTTKVYYTYTLDGGTTWNAGDAAYMEGTAAAVQQLWTPMSGSRFYVIWRVGTTLLGNKVNSLIQLGTQLPTIASGSVVRAPTVTPPPQGVTTVFRASAQVLNTPTVALSQSIVGTTRTTAATMNAPTVVLGAAPPASAGFTHYFSITVQAAMVSSPQTDFPMLVSYTRTGLKSLANGGHVANPNGYDIRPYDAVGGLPLTFELESYDPVTGTLVLWVKVPTLVGGTEIYLYYGDSTLSTNASATSTWESAFQAVYHLKSGALGADSTSNGLTQSLLGTTPPAAATGHVGGGAVFDGVTSYTQSAVSGATTFPLTYSCWAKLASTTPADGEGGTLICQIKHSSLDLILLYYVRVDGNGGTGLRMVTQDATGANAQSNIFNLTLDTNWHHFVAVFATSTSWTLYMDGSPVTWTQIAPAGTPPNPPSGLDTLHLGALYYNTSTFYAPLNGLMDETRIASVARSAEYALTEYRNQSNPSTFATVGGETTVATAFTHYTPVTVQSGQVTGTLTDFPVLISYTDARLKSVANGGHVASANGYDIQPYIGTRLLIYELETYDPVTGTVVMWANVPTLTAGTVITLYYGDPALTTDNSSVLTWNSEFTAVWHASAATPMKDSTSHALTLTNVGGNPSNTGQIEQGISTVDPRLGGGPDFSGKYLTVRSGAFNFTSEPFTFSWWFYPTAWITTSGAAVPLWRGKPQDFANGDPAGGYYVTIGQSGSINFSTHQLGATQASGTDVGQAVTGVWVHIACVRNGSSVRVYVNGVDATVSVDTHLNPASTPVHLNWGAWDDGNTSLAAPGVYDEMHVSQAARSAAWIEAEYKNQFAPSTFAPLGTEVIVTSGGGTQTVLATFVASASQVFLPSVTVGPVAVTTATRATTLQVFAPLVATGPVTILGATVAVTWQTFSPTLTTGAVTVTTPGRVTTIQVFAPTVQALLLGATIPKGSGAFAPSVTLTVTAATRPATSQTFVPTVAVAPTGALGATTITSTFQIFAPTIGAAAVVVTGAHIGSVQSIAPPVVSVGSVAITGAHLTSTAQLFALVLIAKLEGTFITSTRVLFAPVLQVQQTVKGGTILSGTLVFGSSVSTGAATVTVGGLVSSARVFPPSLSRFVPGTSLVSSGVVVRPLVTSATITHVVAAQGSVTVRYLPISHGVVVGRL